MLVAPRVVLVCCVLPWSFPARVSCPRLRFLGLIVLTTVEICESCSIPQSIPRQPLRRRAPDAVQGPLTVRAAICPQRAFTHRRLRLRLLPPIRHGAAASKD